jgi:hypothetical protein
MSNTTVTVSETDVTEVTISTVAPSATSIRNVAISAVAPSAGQALITTSATAAAWADIATQAELEAWVGSTNITTLGTISTGTWSATTIATTKGGTGLTSYVLGDVLYASAANVLSALAGQTTTTRKFLRQTGDGALSAAPAWDTLTAADISGGTFNAGTYSLAGSTLTLADTLAGAPTWSSTQSLDTSGNAATATLAATVTVVDSTSATCSVALFDAATGSLAAKTDAGLTYAATTGILTATGFSGPLTGDVTGNVTGSSGSTTGNAATATALATARAINGVDFDGTAAITVTAAAGTLTGTTLAATVVTSSLTSVGTLASGAVPASLVTAGSFGSGDYTLTGKLTFAGTPTLTDASVGFVAANGLTIRGIAGTTYQLALVSKSNSAVVIGIADSSLEVTITQDTTISGRLYVQSTGFASIIDRNLQIGNGALTSGAGRLIVDGNTTASTGLAQQGYISGALIAAANSDSLYGLNVAPAFTPGAFTGVTQYGVKIGDVAGGATNYALHTGTGSVLFGGLVTGSAGFSGALNGTVGATTPAAGAFTTLTAGDVVSAAKSADALTTLFSFRNASAGTAAGTRFRIGNAVNEVGFFIDVYGSSHATLAYRVNIINNYAATLALGTNGTSRWVITSVGHLLTAADNTYDIGASGATRPRDLYLGRNAIITGTLSCAALTTNGGLQTFGGNDGAACPAGFRYVLVPNA